MVLAHNLENNQKTNDILISQNVTFDTMLLSSNTLEGLKKSGFVRPSPIQLYSIPIGKCGFDLLLEAKSGTGKTAVFTVITLEKLDLDKGLQVVILAPTREIAAQVCDVIRQIGCQYNGLCVEVVMGGLPVQEDIEKFKKNKVHVVVGSPGRLKHLICDNHMDISAVRLLVLDEADKLMEKSFLSDIKYIHLTLPKEKQVIMSSATFPESCKECIGEFVHDAQHICPDSDCILLGIVQKVTYVKYNSNTVIQTTNRFKELLKIITTKQFKQCLIFCNYQARVGEVYKMLKRAKWPAEQLYGAQDQMDRLGALKTLQEYKCRILISTDLAARGIDASNVDLVINFEPPFEWQTYLHRIGRAGRFGSYGMAITILSEGTEQKKFMNVLSATNLSIKLTSLWTENESNNAEQVEEFGAKPLQLNGSNDHGSTELLKIICENSSADKTIEDFHALFDSFQNNCLPDTNGVQYKCIECPKLSTKQYLIGIKTNEETAQDTNNIYGSQERICSKYKKLSENKEQNISKTNKGFNVKMYNNLSNQECNTQSNKFEMTGPAKTNVDFHHNSNLYEKHKSHHNRKKISSSSSEDSKTESEKSNYKYRTQTKVRNKQHSLSSTCDPHSSMDLCSSTSDSEYPTKEHMYTNSYITWYRELKIRMKQIELAVYVDELSKL